MQAEALQRYTKHHMVSKKKNICTHTWIRNEKNQNVTCNT